MSNTTTVFVVDDDSAIRDSLTSLLTTAGMHVNTYETGWHFLQGYDPEMKGCVLLDVRMPRLNGLELLSELRERKCRLPIVIMTAHGEIKIAVQAMKLGAADFIEKPFRENALISTINSALEESDRELADEQAGGMFLSGISNLTERERQVFDMLVQCDSNKVIAAKLNISPRTVEIHRARVMNKLGMENLSQLLRLATKTGFI